MGRKYSLKEVSSDDHCPWENTLTPSNLLSQFHPSSSYLLISIINQILKLQVKLSMSWFLVFFPGCRKALNLDSRNESAKDLATILISSHWNLLFRLAKLPFAQSSAAHVSQYGCSGDDHHLMLWLSHYFGNILGVFCSNAL